MGTMKEEKERASSEVQPYLPVRTSCRPLKGEEEGGREEEREVGIGRENETERREGGMEGGREGGRKRERGRQGEREREGWRDGG